MKVTTFDVPEDALRAALDLVANRAVEKFVVSERYELALSAQLPDPILDSVLAASPWLFVMSPLAVIEQDALTEAHMRSLLDFVWNHSKYTEIVDRLIPLATELGDRQLLGLGFVLDRCDLPRTDGPSDVLAWVRGCGTMSDAAWEVQSSLLEDACSNLEGEHLLTDRLNGIQQAALDASRDLVSSR